MPPLRILFDFVLLDAATLVGTAAVSGAATWLALGEWRRSAGQHWTERARALHRARMACGLNVGLVVLGAIIVTGYFSDSFADSFPWSALIAALLGTIAGSYPLQRARFPQQTLKEWIAAIAIQLSLQVVGLGLLVVCVFLMPRNFGLKTWLIAGGWIGVQLVFSFGLWLRFLRFVHLLHRPSERLARIVSETSVRGGIPVRHVWELTSAVSQAGVLLATRTLFFTRPLLERLTDAEIESICLHELAHLTEPRSVFWLRELAQFSRVPLLFALPVAAHFGANAAFGMIALVVCAPFALIRVRRRMEQRADRLAVAATADPVVYARALEKIYEANQMPAVVGGLARGVHPSLYDRMVAAGVTPDYPRPAKPKRFHWTTGVLLILVAMAFVVLVVLD